jgi:signal peptide peptidase SppA
MHQLPLLAQRLYNTPLWAKPRFAETVSSLLAGRMGVKPMLDDSQMDREARDVYGPTTDKNGIMTIPVTGGLAHRGDGLDAMCGMQSYTNLQNTFLQGLEDSSVKGFLLDIDSPGGEASGCLDLADTILQVRQEKPVWGIANGQAASAAYAIGCSCERLYMTSTGEVGSIGVVALHVDHSAMLKNEGLVVTFIHAGARKVDGNFAEPLSDVARAEWQEAVEYSYERFVTAVAQRRPISAEEIRATEARTYTADKAVALKLVDGVSNYEATRLEMGQHVRKQQLKVINGKAVVYG